MPDFDSPLHQCDLCDSPHIHPHLTDYRGIQIFKCANCRIEFMNPQYSDEYLANFYSGYQAMDEKHHRYFKAENLRKYLHALNLTDIEKFVAPGKFLSVGCGRGHDLMVAQERGWQPEGYEVDPDFTKQLSKELGMSIRSGQFVDLVYDPHDYDCVYLNHVIEHPKNPSAYLKKCYDLLKKGGILYIACPNIAAFSVKMKKGLELLHLKKKKGSYYDSWQHLFYYSPFTLKDLLEKHYQFKVVLLGNDRKFKPEQSALSRKIIEKQAYSYPYKASFRLLAMKI